KSGKSFAYKHLPFWLASLVDRALVLIVPIAVLLIPGLRIVPLLYRWRINARIYKRYGELMALERIAFGKTTPEQRTDLLARLARRGPPPGRRLFCLGSRQGRWLPGGSGSTDGSGRGDSPRSSRPSTRTAGSWR